MQINVQTTVDVVSTDELNEILPTLATKEELSQAQVDQAAVDAAVQAAVGNLDLVSNTNFNNTVQTLATKEELQVAVSDKVTTETFTNAMTSVDTALQSLTSAVANHTHETSQIVGLDAELASINATLQSLPEQGGQVVVQEGMADESLKSFVANFKTAFPDYPINQGMIGRAISVGGQSIHRDGVVEINVIGNPESKSISDATYLNKHRRFGCLSNSTSNSVVAYYHDVADFLIGSSFIYTKFAITDSVTNANMFVGISADINEPSNIHPDLLRNCIGIGHAGGHGMMKIYSADSAISTNVTLSGFHVAENEVYELGIFSFVQGDIKYLVKRSTTGEITHGTLSSNIPSGVVSAFRAWRSNNTDSVPVGLDFISLYEGHYA